MFNCLVVNEFLSFIKTSSAHALEQVHSPIKWVERGGSCQGAKVFSYAQKGCAAAAGSLQQLPCAVSRPYGRGFLVLTLYSCGAAGIHPATLLCQDIYICIKVYISMALCNDPKGTSVLSISIPSFPVQETCISPAASASCSALWSPVPGDRKKLSSWVRFSTWSSLHSLILMPRELIWYCNSCNRQIS